MPVAVISLLNLAVGLLSQPPFPGRPLPAHARPPSWTRSIAEVLLSTLILLPLVFLVNYLRPLGLAVSSCERLLSTVWVDVPPSPSYGRLGSLGGPIRRL